MRFNAALCCVGGLLLAALPSRVCVRAQEGEKNDVVNPIYTHGSKFKPGATVTRREKVKFPADSEEGQIYPEHTLIKDNVIKLLEVTPKKIVVELTELEHNRGFIREAAPIKLIYFSHTRKGLGTPKESFDKHKEQDVDVTIKGKTYKTTLVETTHKDKSGVTRSQKIWLSDDIPGGIVKDEKTQKHGDQLISESTLEVLSYKVP